VREGSPCHPTEQAPFEGPSRVGARVLGVKSQSTSGARPGRTSWWRRGEADAFVGASFWMYCGELDHDPGWPMCDNMEQARAFLLQHGAQVTSLVRNATGEHRSLPLTPEAVQAMFAFLDAQSRTLIAGMHVPWGGARRTGAPRGADRPDRPGGDSGY